MDRETIVRASRGFNGLDVPDVGVVQPILYSFLCEEHKKPKDKVGLFIHTIFHTASWLPYFEFALLYYERKYAIHKLKKKNGEIIAIF